MAPRGRNIPQVLLWVVRMHVVMCVIRVIVESNYTLAAEDPKQHKEETTGDHGRPREATGRGRPRETTGHGRPQETTGDHGRPRETSHQKRIRAHNHPLRNNIYRTLTDNFTECCIYPQHVV